MKALYCVDYLAHAWEPEDLVRSYREIRKKLVDVSHKTFLRDAFGEDLKGYGRRRGTLRNKEQYHAVAEEYRLKRLENALWRSMARHCTSELGRPNKLVDPGDINWQKATDITWLYGPFYQKDTGIISVSPLNTPDSGTPAVSPIHELPAPSFIKPVLKKRDPPQDFDALQDSALGIDPDAITKATGNTEPIEYHGRRRTTWPEANVDKKAIRFNPNVALVEFTPSSPVMRLSISRHGSQKAQYPRKQKNWKSRYSDAEELHEWLPPSPPPSPPSAPAPPAEFEDEDPLELELDSEQEEGDEFDQNQDNSQSVLALTTQVASNVKDIAVLCGTIAIYKGISLTFSPIAWVAERIAGRD